MARKRRGRGSKSLLIKARAVGWQKSKARGRSYEPIPPKPLGRKGRKR